jgi:hypothetical protein
MILQHYTLFILSIFLTGKLNITNSCQKLFLNMRDEFQK